MPNLVRLPEQRHFFGDALVRIGLFGRGDARVVEQPQLAGDADVGQQHRPPSRLSGVRRQDESDRRALRAGVERRVEPAERVLQRLAGNDAVVCVLTPTAQAVVLLGEIRELEVQAERTQDKPLLMLLERLDDGDRSGVPRVARSEPRAFDELEQPRAFLLDQHLAEHVTQHPHVATERRGGVGHATR